MLGESIGRATAAMDRRVLFLGSGGLSHDPPVPKLEGAAPEVAEMLIAGRNPSDEATARRRANVVGTAQALTAGTATIAPLEPSWDQDVMQMLAERKLADFDAWTPEQFAADAGNSAHEVRTWIAAFSALSTYGDYRVSSTFYHPIPEWICGFGVMTAATA
jgi:2,3-dihydroxyphenylpropionate 1,2-dioxygenase